MPQDNENAKAGDTAEGTSETPKYATLDEITNAVSEMVNKAITARNKQVEAKVDKMFGDFTTKLEERLSKFNTPAPTDEQTDKTEAKQKSKAPVESEESKLLKQKVIELEAKYEAAEAKSRQATAKERDNKLRQQLSDELVKGGIDPSRVRHAVGLLVDADKRLRYSDDESDEVVFKDLDDQDVDFRSGIKSWLKSEDAKIYMPPRGSTGSGDRRPTERTASKTGVNPLEEVGNSLFEAFKRGDL